MAQLTTLARPYARAAFEYASEHNAVPKWLNLLQSCGLLMQHDEVAEYIMNPKVSNQKAVSFFKDVFGDELNQQQENFLHLLASNRQLNLLPEISALFTYYNEQEGKIETVNVQSAHELTAAQQQRLIESLEKRLHKKIKLECTVNPDLIGGAVLRTHEWVMDGSVKGRISQLKTKLVG